MASKLWSDKSDIQTIDKQSDITISMYVCIYTYLVWLFFVTDKRQNGWTGPKKMLGTNFWKSTKKIILNPRNFCYLNNKTRHSYIYVTYSRPNGWTDWAEFFCGHSWVAGGCYRLKDSKLKKKYKFLFFPRATPGPSASCFIMYKVLKVEIENGREAP